MALIPGVKKYVIANIKKPIKKGEEFFFKYDLDFICECQVLFSQKQIFIQTKLLFYRNAQVGLLKMKFWNQDQEKWQESVNNILYINQVIIISFSKVV
jgi:hypothetical protein